MATFIYCWKTPDNKRHTGEIDARDRESVYAMLKERGIRAIKVEPKGEAAGSGTTRWIIAVIVATCVVALGATTWWMATRDGTPREGSVETRAVSDAPGGDVPKARRRIESNVVEIRPGRRIAKPRPRRQVKGLAGSGVRLENVFRHESERVLALFAQPGRMPAAVPTATPELSEDFYDAMDDAIWIETEDSKAVADLKRIVAGLKEEAEIYLSSGTGVKGLLDYLMSRQRMESEYRTSVIGDYDAAAADAPERRAGINAQLSAMGLEPVGEM